MYASHDLVASPCGATARSLLPNSSSILVTRGCWAAAPQHKIASFSAANAGLFRTQPVAAAAGYSSISRPFAARTGARSQTSMTLWPAW